MAGFMDPILAQISRQGDIMMYGQQLQRQRQQDEQAQRQQGLQERMTLAQLAALEQQQALGNKRRQTLADLVKPRQVGGPLAGVDQYQPVGMQTPQFDDSAAYHALMGIGDIEGAMPFKPEVVDPYEKLPGDIRAYMTAGTDPAVRQAIEAQIRDKQRAAAAGATNVNNILDRGGPKFGTIPPGMMLVQDESGGYKMSPVPGSPAEREEIDSKKKADLTLRNARAKGRVVASNIDKALGKTGLFTTGFVGKALSAIPGSPAYDLGQTLETVKANIGFDTLQKMREASPTGGALGAVSERELSQLERVLGSLNQAQSREQLVENLIAVKTHYNNWKAIMEEAGKTPSAWTGQDESGGIKWDSQ